MADSKVEQVQVTPADDDAIHSASAGGILVAEGTGKTAQMEGATTKNVHSVSTLSCPQNDASWNPSLLTLPGRALCCPPGIAHSEMEQFVDSSVL